MSFDQLYYLEENYTDHYYTSVIKTFVEIIKQSVKDRQIVLLIMARGLKYLEDLARDSCSCSLSWKSIIFFWTV